MGSGFLPCTWPNAMTEEESVTTTLPDFLLLLHTITIMIIMEFSSTLLLSLISVFHYYYYSTVWKLKDFSVTQILREINILQIQSLRKSLKCMAVFLGYEIMYWFHAKFEWQKNSQILTLFTTTFNAMFFYFSTRSIKNISIPYYYYYEKISQLLRK